MARREQLFNYRRGTEFDPGSAPPAGKWFRSDAKRAGVVLAILAWTLAAWGVTSAMGRASAQAEPVRGARARASLTAPRLAADLRAAALITKVPANLTPPLSNAAVSRPIIVNNGCQLWSGEVESKPCAYGDTKSRTVVALFGDSHASAWFPALERISRRRRWRLVVFTKAGCSPPEVTLVSGGARHLDCNRWRHNSEQRIAELHPALVFVSWARWIEARARAEAGVPTGYGSPWQDGIAATFRFLRRAARRVIFVSDVPTFSFRAVDCISSHISDVRPCNNTPRSAVIVLPTIRAQELQVAARMHVDSIDPIPWFCTPTVCPVLVRNILVYRDTAHMTPPWSKFIAPVLAKSIASILGVAPAAL